MTDLTGRLISNTYKQLILVSSAVSNEGVSTSLKPIQTGDGTNTALKVATNAVQVSGALGVAGSVSLDNNLHVDNRVCASAFYGDGSNITGVTAVIAGNISVSNAVVGGTLQVSSTATIVGATHLKSTVTVGGAANFGSTVTVEGKAVFKDDVSVSGAANFGSTVTVEGRAIFNENVSVSGTFNVAGASTFTSKATFDNDVSVSGRLDVATSACIGGLAKFKDAVSVSGGLNVGGSVTIAGTNIQATNAKVCASAFYGDGSNLTNVEAQLGVTTNISVSGFINVGGAVSVSGTFNAVGSSTFKNDVSVSGNLRIGGTTTIAGAVSLASTLSVAGATNFASTVTIAGATSLGSTLDITGNTSVGGTLITTGKAEFEDDVSVSGNSNFGGTVTIGGAVSLASTLSVGGAANFLSTVTIAGNNVQAANARVCASAYYGDGSNLSGVTTSIEGDVSVSALTVGGEISVSGGRITIKTSASDPANIRFYCESNNAHYAELRSPPHASYAGNITITLPNTTVTLVGTSTTNTLINKTFGDKVEFDSDICVSGNSNLVGNVSVGGTFLATGKGEFEDDVSVSGALVVGGASQLNSTVTVAGAAIFEDSVSVSGNIDVAGNVSIGGTLFTTGNTTFDGNVSVSGNVNIGGTTTIGGAVSLGSTLNITGNTSVGGTFLATGKAEFEDDVSVSGALIVGGTTTIAGATHLQSTVSINDVLTLNNNLDMQDNDKILLGTGDDLALYWDGTDGHIEAGGTLNIDGSGETLAKFIDDGAVELYHNNSKKLETTSDGVTLTGNIVLGTSNAGIYLGVTSATAANLLDDYEEGNFTPTLFGSTTGTGSTGSATGTGKYRKVGSICTIQVYFSNVTLSSQSGQLSFGALPFDSVGAYGVGAPMMYGVDFPANSYVVGYISGTAVGMYSVTDNAAWGQVAVENQSGLYLTHAFTYITT